MRSEFPPLPVSWRPLLATTALALVVAACGKTEPVATAAATPRPVQVIQVAAPDHDVERSYTGTLRARVETDMAFRVAGKISRRAVDVGAKVKAGQVLAELDPVDYRLAVAAAEAQVAAAAASAKQTAADEIRYRDLLAKGHVSQSDYDRRRAASDAAREQAEAARRQLDLARNRLAYTTLTADADGVVTAVNAETGQVVADGKAVLRVARLGEVEAVVSIPESRLDDLTSGRASVSYWADPDTRIPATLRELAPDADPVTRTYSARFSLPAETAHPLGMTATVHLEGQAQERAIRLPRSAVVDFGKGPQVWVVDTATGRLKPTAVTVTGSGGDTVVVKGPVTPGAFVVAIGAHRLDGSEAVQVAEVRR